MNQLNSVLIEGDLIANPTFEEKTGVCSFSILNQMEKESVTVNIKIIGDFAKRCLMYLREKRTVRIVGRIAQENSTSLYILAEHVEFKPVKI
jgi:hypothetical protein